MMKNRVYFIFLLLPLLGAPACEERSQEPQVVAVEDCLATADGELIEGEMLGSEPKLCVFEASIVHVTGFSCPDALPHQMDFGGAVMCSEEAVMPDSDEVTEMVPDAELLCPSGCEHGETCHNGKCEVPYRFVMVEDLGDRTEPYPGADVDAVLLHKEDGRTLPLVTLEDWETLYVGAYDSQDPTQLLGSPDSNCDPDSGRFYSLGGYGSYIVGSFGDQILAGDAVEVVEFGSTNCGEPYEDEPYAVAISIDADPGQFIEIGEGSGVATIPVPGLP